MAENHSVEVPINLPAEDDCAQCVTRLEEHIRETRGVERVEVQGKAHTMLVDFDPDVLTVRGLEERAREACAFLAESYCHSNLVLTGLDCADCAKSIEKAVERRDGILYVSVNFATSRLFVEYECTDPHVLERIMSDVRSMGYDVFTEEEYRARRKAESPKPFYLRSRRALSTALSFTLLILGSILWLATSEPRNAATLLLFGAVVAGGWSVARNGYYAVIRTHGVDMNVLMTVAVIGAMFVGEWIEAALVVALFGLGETLEGWAVERTRGSIQQLMDLSPEVALIRHGDHEERVPVEEVRLGQVVVVKPGDKIPLDGVVIKGRSAVDESPITGESIPQEKLVEDQVFAGTINGRGTLEVEVTARAEDSTLARLIKLVEEAQGQKAPSERWVDSFARWYTPAVMVIAFVTAVGPPLAVGADWDTWIYRALALLILACPCALVISTPVSIVSAIGAASRQGVLIKGGAHLEAAGSLRAIAFDKTGTLTEGLPRVTHVRPFNGASEGEILALTASLERDSEHPLAEAVLHAAATRDLPLEDVHDFEAIPGRGARARVNGSAYLVGNPRLFEESGAGLLPQVSEYVVERQERGETVILVGSDDGAIGAIAIADEVRPASRQIVEDLRSAGVEYVTMLTGDNRRTAAAVGRTVGLDDVRSELLPEDKVTAVRELLAEHGRVGMVGDGINDAPALATATVGIAMGTAGSDTAIETADIALMADDLSRVPFTIRLSRAARATVRQNIGFALGLKIVATLLVFPGWLTLWMAVLADTGGSLVVIANGLRLLGAGKKERLDEETAAHLQAREAATAVAAGEVADGIAAGGAPTATTEELLEEHTDLEHEVDHRGAAVSVERHGGGLPRRPKRRTSPAPEPVTCGCDGEAGGPPGG